MSLPASRSIKDGLLERVQTIARPLPSIITTASPVEIKNVEYIGSYNWLDRNLPTLIVPGSPKEWVNKQMPFTLGRDVGIVVADQNGYRVPDAILLPLFVAVNIKSSRDAATDTDTSPNFDWPTHDFITDRNSLRKLLRWIAASEDAPNSDFRIDVQLAGKRTVLLCRYSTNVREMAGNGFGHNYEKACTGRGHHRIIRYDMNELKMIVRYDVNAYVPDGALPDTTPPDRSWRNSPSANLACTERVEITSKQRRGPSSGACNCPYHKGHEMKPNMPTSFRLPSSSLSIVCTSNTLHPQRQTQRVKHQRTANDDAALECMTNVFIGKDYD